MTVNIPIQSKTKDQSPKMEKCKWCGEIAYLSKHHTSYDPPITVMICKKCHYYVHRKNIGYTFKHPFCQKKFILDYDWIDAFGLRASYVCVDICGECNTCEIFKPIFLKEAMQAQEEDVLG